MKVWQLLKTSRQWTQGALARDKNRVGVHVENPSAISYCIVGALWKCYTGLKFRKMQNLLCDRVGDLVAWNNHPKRKFSEVKKLVKDLDI